MKIDVLVVVELMPHHLIVVGLDMLYFQMQIIY